MTKDKILKLNVITAPNTWFISNSDNKSYGSSFTTYYYNGKQPKQSFSSKWYEIEPNATKVQKKISGQRINTRYELKNPKLECEEYPLSLNDKEYHDKAYIYDDYGDYEETKSEYTALYEYKYDTAPDYFEDITVEFQYLYKLDKNIEKPTIDYEAVPTWNVKNIHINNKDIIHQELDKILFPDLLLSELPASFSSKDMYDITRAYIKNNINNSYATITSDYDFCFTVEKLVKKNIPDTRVYYDLFARTKKARNTPKIANVEYNKYKIFEMTYSPKNYTGYTAIPAMYANNEAELKEKVDAWLEYIIGVINEPLCECKTCNGKGYLIQDKINVKEKCK